MKKYCYIVISGNFTDRELLGTFSSKKKAMQFFNKFVNNDGYSIDYYHKTDYRGNSELLYNGQVLLGINVKNKSNFIIDTYELIKLEVK